MDKFMGQFNQWSKCQASKSTIKIIMVIMVIMIIMITMIITIKMIITYHRVSAANPNMDSKGCILPPDHRYDDAADDGGDGDDTDADVDDDDGGDDNADVDAWGIHVGDSSE